MKVIYGISSMSLNQQKMCTKHLLTSVFVSGPFLFKAICLTNATSKVMQKKTQQYSCFCYILFYQFALIKDQSNTYFSCICIHSVCVNFVHVKECAAFSRCLHVMISKIPIKNQQSFCNKFLNEFLTNKQHSLVKCAIFLYIILHFRCWDGSKTSYTPVPSSKAKMLRNKLTFC